MKPKGLRLVWMNNEQSEAKSAILSLQLFKPHRVPYRICYQIPRRRPDPKRLADAAKKQFGLRRDQLHETVQRVTPVAGKGTLEEREPGCFDFLHEVAYPGRDQARLDTCLLGETLPMFPPDRCRIPLPSDPHGEPSGEAVTGIDPRGELVVKGSQHRPLGEQQEREVFAVGVGVSDQVIEDRPVDQRQRVPAGPDAGPAHQVEAGGK